MFRSIRIAAATIAAVLLLASPAAAEIVHADGESFANDYRLTWDVKWDTVSRAVTADVTQIDTRTGLPSNLKGIADDPDGRDGAGLVVGLANGQTRAFDFFTLGLVNAGPTVFPNVNARSFVQRGGESGLTFEDWFTPPAR